MIKRMLASALVAGCAAWLLAAVLHFAFVQDYILLAEDYETGTAVHFGSATPPAEEPASTTLPAEEPASAAPAEGTGAGLDSAAADTGDDMAAMSGDATRNLWTAVFFGLVYVAYALLMVAGFGLAQVYGKVITAREGLLWGLGGFFALVLAPAMGLAPGLPGTVAAEIGARQAWWLGTAVSAAIALGLLGYGRGPLAILAAVVLLAAPHLIGAPQLDGFNGTSPPEVAAAFSARVLGVAFVVWAVMGWVAGFVWAREADKPA